MDDLIRRSDAIRAIEERSFAVRDLYTVKAIIRNIKAVEPNEYADIAYGIGVCQGKANDEPRQGENIGTDYAECDQFICSECGIHLQGWVRIDEDDYDDGIVHEYEFRFCPNCGAKMKGADGELQEKNR